MAKYLLLFHLSFLLVSCFTVYGEEQGIVSFVAQAPDHHSITPAPAPGPHNHQSHPPTIASPVHAPTHAPVQAPTHAPTHTPTHAPVNPPHVAPSQPPTHAPTHAPPPHVAPSQPPTHTPTHAPVNPPHFAPSKPPTHAPTHAPPPHVAPSKPPSPHFPRSFVEVQGVVYCKSCKYAGADTLLGATPLPNATVKLQCNNSKHPRTVVEKTDKNGYFLFKAPKTITNYGVHKCKVFLVSSSSASCQKPSNLHGGAKGASLRHEKIKSVKPLVALFTVGPLAFEPKCPHH